MGTYAGCTGCEVAHQLQAGLWPCAPPMFAKPAADQDLEPAQQMPCCAGDSLGLYVLPDKDSDLPSIGVRNRLNSSLPLLTPDDETSKSSSAASTNDVSHHRRRQLLQDAGEKQPWSSLGSELTKVRAASGPDGQGGKPGQNRASSDEEYAKNAALAVQQVAARETLRLWAQAQGAAGGSGGGKKRPTEPGSPFGEFALTLLTASPAAAQRVTEVLQPVLARVGLDTAGGPGGYGSRRKES